MQEYKITQFASDNYVGTHPEIIKIINESMLATELPYGNDTYSVKAKEEFRRIFQTDCDIYFFGTGTASNVIALQSGLRSIDGVLCSDIAHIAQDECGAFENFTGAKLFTIKNENGKITLENLKEYLNTISPIRNNYPKIVSLTQVTEYGTIYTQEELKEICSYAHSKSMIVHMDGARLANAAASLNKSLKELTVDVGIDILSFGATKNGALLAEAVVIFNKSLIKDFEYIHKQSMQLFSKIRFIPAQFLAFLKNDLWLSNAQNSNAMAQKVSMGLKSIKSIKQLYPVDANEIFLELPTTLKDEIAKKYYFYVFAENLKEMTSTIRFVTSFNTTNEDVTKLIEEIKKLAKPYN
ncbi:threonine aldolase family protein [Fluviispira multicolorata]|uniref:Aminotransferase class V-fold PLP-dependent enzyme n=1 Tax=Fluviispira multicolorata TaxID=2654512 RepID=A0A833N3U3_9BACT|nr:aminotransferase class V-fold PLP-dependent enzyme [Fluviispira multicolorata]KAB8029182.1 aminotransferase class V-fold PLP-dependent enzyme [Fluviispira multicolorata]